jgi:hypothetical protein
MLVWSLFQPKWEQAVRRILWNDEHVVFAVLGGWVRILLVGHSCKYENPCIVAFVQSLFVEYTNFLAEVDLVLRLLSTTA